MYILCGRMCWKLRAQTFRVLPINVWPRRVFGTRLQKITGTLSQLKGDRWYFSNLAIFPIFLASKIHSVSATRGQESSIFYLSPISKALMVLKKKYIYFRK